MNRAIRHAFSLLHNLRNGFFDIRHSLQVFEQLNGFLSGIYWAGVIDFDQYDALGRLATEAFIFCGKPFPHASNAGPCLSALARYERNKEAVKPQANPAVTHMGGYDFVDASLLKPQAQVPANEKPEPVSAPATPRELRLLCLLVETSTESYTVPLGTMHPVPPRASINGRWPSAGSPGVVLRQTHAQRPTAQVLARLQRHGQANAIRATARTVQLGVTA